MMSGETREMTREELLAEYMKRGKKIKELEEKLKEESERLFRHMGLLAKKEKEIAELKEEAGVLKIQKEHFTAFIADHQSEWDLWNRTIWDGPPKEPKAGNSDGKQGV
jgi:5-bromo-4-chloroindolyl phosphate hydrolysis protein